MWEKQRLRWKAAIKEQMLLVKRDAYNHASNVIAQGTANAKPQLQHMSTEFLHGFNMATEVAVEYLRSEAKKMEEMSKHEADQSKAAGMGSRLTSW